MKAFSIAWRWHAEGITPVDIPHPWYLMSPQTNRCTWLLSEELDQRHLQHKRNEQSCAGRNLSSARKPVLALPGVVQLRFICLSQKQLSCRSFTSIGNLQEEPGEPSAQFCSANSFNIWKHYSFLGAGLQKWTAMTIFFHHHPSYRRQNPLARALSTRNHLSLHMERDQSQPHQIELKEKAFKRPAWLLQSMNPRKTVKSHPQLWGQGCFSHSKKWWAV